jgi:putative zinc finger/helix-turn-helix YgiT family protein
MKDFCPYCEKTTDISLVTKRETLPVLGEPVEYDASLYKCDECQDDYATASLEKINFKTAYNIYRNRHGLLTPEKIRQIREMYGLTQKQFSLFLGWGEITIHRYEAGAIQDKVHNETLALLENPKNALTILDLNRNDLDATFAQILETRIEELASKSSGKFCVYDILATWSYNQIQSSLSNKELHGRQLFDVVRLENLMLHILTQHNGVMKTKLNKLLWYCDFKNCKEFGLSLTGSRYVHLQYGPVPDNYDLLLWMLSVQNKITSRELVFDNFTGEEYYANNQPDCSIFSSVELGVVDTVIARFKHMSAKEISDYSHKEVGYKETKQNDLIPYTYASELSI